MSKNNTCSNIPSSQTFRSIHHYISNHAKHNNQQRSSLTKPYESELLVSHIHNMTNINIRKQKVLGRNNWLLSVHYILSIWTQDCIQNTIVNIILLLHISCCRNIFSKSLPDNDGRDTARWFQKSLPTPFCLLKYGKHSK